jgi:pyridoxamine 5'-phosphate oxidase
MLPQPIVDQIEELIARARAAGDPEPTAMSLATADAHARPSVRTVLLKQVDASGFVFYTNTHSDKGRQLAQNPQAAICLHWRQLELQVQVRAEGRVEPVTEADADAYFASRPRGSQIGAWASMQSQTLPSRRELEARVAAVEARYADQSIPRPPHWSGYRLVPDRVEFWFGREYRLHDRIVHLAGDDGWSESRLYP